MHCFPRAGYVSVRALRGIHSTTVFTLQSASDNDLLHQLQTRQFARAEHPQANQVPVLLADHHQSNLPDDPVFSGHFLQVHRVFEIGIRQCAIVFLDGVARELHSRRLFHQI